MEDSPVWTLGDLRFDPDRRDANGVLWFVSEETGFFGAPDNTGETTQRLNQHGAFRSPGWKKERTISLKGHAFAGSYPALRRAVHQMTGMLADPWQDAALTCYTELGPLTAQVYLDGDILTTPLDIYNPGIEWSLQLVAPDPRKYSIVRRTFRADLPRFDTDDGLDFSVGRSSPPEDVFTVFAAAPSDGVGLDFHTDGGLKFGESNATGFLQLTNTGTAPTSPTYTLHGPLTNPLITATTEGQRSEMRYNDTLGERESIVIDPSAPSVLLEGTASRRHLLNPAQFAGFAIPGVGVDDGHLSVGLTHEGESTAGGYVTATFREAWF